MHFFHPVKDKKDKAYFFKKVLDKSAVTMYNNAVSVKALAGVAE